MKGDSWRNVLGSRISFFFIYILAFLVSIKIVRGEAPDMYRLTGISHI